MERLLSPLSGLPVKWVSRVTASMYNNLPTAAVHDLAVHPRGGELVAGTHGRSIVVLDVKPTRGRN